MGGQANELIERYLKYVGRSLKPIQVSDGIYVTQVTDILLKDYIHVCSCYCEVYHTSISKCVCQQMCEAGKLVLKRCIVPLPVLFRTCFEGKCYSANVARQQLLQMPLAAVRVESVQSGQSEYQVMEFRKDFDFSSMQNYLQSSRINQTKESLTKTEFRELLAFAQSRREREVLKYAVIKASGLSATAARKKLGIESVCDRLKAVEQALTEAEELRKSIDDLCSTTEEAVLQSLGLKGDSESDESEYEDSGNITSSLCNLPPEDELLRLCRESCCNWFEVIDQLAVLGVPETSEVCKEVYSIICKAVLPEEYTLLKQSYDAYCWDRDVQMPVRKADVDSLNGLVVFDSGGEGETERSSSSPDLQEIAAKRIKTIHRHKRYLKAKAFVERNFLSRRTSKRTSTILTKFPDIGHMIEQYVQDNSVGADRWRRTGILTFDGNTRVGQKVTFKRIKDHLQEVYGCKFSYGSVVELCVARNKRRRSAKRYHGVAQVTCRRARKGFQLKYNPDAHWSAAFYRGLSSIQYQDGRNIVNLNRDDASGFRLDTKYSSSAQDSRSQGERDCYYIHRLCE